MFAGTFAPRGWAYCDGQLLAIAQNDILFSLFGTIYGGDGRTTFGLPDLRGRLPLHAGTGPGYSPRKLGSLGGSETETLTVNQLPAHTHDYNGNTQPGNMNTPAGNVVAARAAAPTYSESDQDTNMASNSIANTGRSQAHTNLMPSLCVHFIVALFGIYPSRQ